MPERNRETMDGCRPSAMCAWTPARCWSPERVRRDYLMLTNMPQAPANAAPEKTISGLSQNALP